MQPTKPVLRHKRRLKHSIQAHVAFPMKAPLLTFMCLGSLALVLVGASERLGHTHGLGVRPDVSGTWDMLTDDVIEVEVRSSGDAYSARTRAEGGRVAFHDAGTLIELELDCARPDLLCPHELLARELVLDNRSGDLSDDGDKFVLSFEGEGEGACRLLPGSLASADVDTQGSPVTGDYRAVSLTGGVISVALSASCFGADTGLSPDTEVVLSSGFTAARR
jgi:hypothetical protein